MTNNNKAKINLSISIHIDIDTVYMTIDEYRQYIYIKLYEIYIYYLYAVKCLITLFLYSSFIMFWDGIESIFYWNSSQ